jgi:hypothetical protein
LTTNRVARIGVGAALAVALAYATAPVPNVELLTLTVFLVGYVGGAFEGVVVGFIAAGVYSTFNPWGAAAPPIIAAQMLGQIFSGVAGCAAGYLRLAKPRVWWSYAMFALLGVGVTLVYDVLVTLAGIWLFGAGEGLLVVLVAGLLFSLVHLISNAVLFALAVPAAARVSSRFSRNS